MAKEQMQKEIDRMNHKIELELTEIKNLAQRILNGADTPCNITFHTPSRMLAQSENTLKELIARREPSKKSSKIWRTELWIRGSIKNSVTAVTNPLRTASV